jgi:hypothetical protein
MICSSTLKKGGIFMRQFNILLILYRNLENKELAPFIYYSNSIFINHAKFRFSP